MSLEVYRTDRANIDANELARQLGISAVLKERQALELRPVSRSEEPAWSKFGGRLAVKSNIHNIEGSGSFIVTRRRLIAGLNGGIKTSRFGSFQKRAAIFFAVEHDDLAEVRALKAPGGGWRRLELLAADGSFVIRVLNTGNFSNVVEALSAEKLEKLDDAGAREIQQRKAEKLELERRTAAQAASEAKRVGAERFAAAQGSGASSGAHRLGLLDHRQDLALQGRRFR